MCVTSRSAYTRFKRTAFPEQNRNAPGRIRFSEWLTIISSARPRTRSGRVKSTVGETLATSLKQDLARTTVPN